MATIRVQLSAEEEAYLQTLLTQLQAHDHKRTTEEMHRAIFVFGIRSLSQLIDRIQGSQLRDWDIDLDGSMSEN